MINKVYLFQPCSKKIITCTHKFVTKKRSNIIFNKIEIAYSKRKPDLVKWYHTDVSYESPAYNKSYVSSVTPF